MTIFDGRDTAAIEACAERLAAGALVAFPTETVYGLGARADDEAAVGRIFAAKERPRSHPLIVHVADADGARIFCDRWPALANRLAEHFWPGPLTLVVPRSAGIAGAAAAGQATIALRAPAHPVARALLRRAASHGVDGIAAPSANRFGRISPTLAAHVASEFGDAVPVLDGGPSAVGIESTIVDCSGDEAALLRPGGIPREAIEALLSAPLREPAADAPRAPGTLASHYAPRARLSLLPAAALDEAAGRDAALGDGIEHVAHGPARQPLGIYSRLVPAGGPTRIVWRRMPDDAEAAAHELFATLRDLDAAGVSRILVEAPPSAPAWEAVRDRLTRAASERPEGFAASHPMESS